MNEFVRVVDGVAHLVGMIKKTKMSDPQFPQEPVQIGWYLRCVPSPDSFVLPSMIPLDAPTTGCVTCLLCIANGD